MSYNPGDNFVTIDTWGGSGKHQSLWGIARDSSLPGYKSDINARVAELKKLNNISNERAIPDGAKIKLTSSTATTTSGNTSNKPTNVTIAVQSGTDRTLYASWSWDRHSQTEKYEYEWYYYTGDSVEWFIGDDGDTKYTHTTYSPPDNAKKVKFRVRPIAVTEEV